MAVRLANAGSVDGEISVLLSFGTPKPWVGFKRVLGLPLTYQDRTTALGFVLIRYAGIPFPTQSTFNSIRRINTI
jgi:hypothetical protein